MKALITGLGSIGKRHLANLRTLEPATEITILRRPSSRGEPIEGAYDRLVFDLDEALAVRPDFALITGPSSLHIEIAVALARNGTHLFIEKPLANTMTGVEELLSLAGQRGIVLMVGYNFRFHKPLEIMKQAVDHGVIGKPLSLRAEVGQFLPDWRRQSDYRKSVTASAATGGGVVLELSHELDYAQWLLGEPRTVSAHTAHLSDMEIDVEDLAEIVMTFANGSVASIHLDMIDHSPYRNCRIVGSTGTITWNVLTNDVQLFSAAKKEWKELHPAIEIDRNQMYLRELDHFLNCVRTGETPLVTGADGRRVLEIALAVKRSAAEHREVVL